MRVRGILLVLLAVQLAGCNNKMCDPELFKPAALASDPEIKCYSDPGASIDKYRTFTVLPESKTTETSCSPAFDNELIEKQMLFALRNAVELVGYEYTEDIGKADVVFTISGSNEYKETYIPPSSITVPVYVPGRTATSTTYNSGRIDVYGDYDSAYGDYSGSSTTTTRTPGYWISRDYTVPGKTVGNYYPLISVDAYDAKTRRVAWHGTGVGCSKNVDIRVSSQVILLGLAEQMPCPKMSPGWTLTTGMIGVSIACYTPDGTNYAPAIIDVAKGYPAAKARLKYGDLIVAINGKSVVNAPVSTIHSMIAGDAGTKCTLTVVRGEKTFDCILERALRQSHE
jgi:hypothetical protein